MYVHMFIYRIYTWMYQYVNWLDNLVRNYLRHKSFVNRISYSSTVGVFNRLMTILCDLDSWTRTLLTSKRGTTKANRFSPIFLVFYGLFTSKNSSISNRWREAHQYSKLQMQTNFQQPKTTEFFKINLYFNFQKRKTCFTNCLLAWLECQIE